VRGRKGCFASKNPVCGRLRCWPSRSAWSAMPVVTARVAEGVPEYLAGGQPGHDDHRAERDVLKGDGQAVIAAIAGHHLGLGAKVAQVVGWRHRHVTILPQPKTAAQ